MARRPETLDDQLRDAVEASGRTNYNVAKQSGISQSTMSRFMAEERGLTAANADLLAAELEFDITLTPRKRRR